MPKIAITQQSQEIYSKLAETFRQIKAETDSQLRNHFDDLFVRTEAAELIEQIGPYIFIGRKGSGKTALIQHFRDTNSSSYDAIIDIVADQENSWLLYRFYHKKFVTLHGETKRFSDLEDVFDLQTLFATAWAGAIQVAIMDRFVRNNSLTSHFTAQAQVRSFLKTQFAIDYEIPETNVAERVHGLLPTLFETIQVIIETILKTHAIGIGVILSRITTWATKSIDERLVEEKANNVIKELLRDGDLRVLVTLDKYDDYVDNLVRSLDDKRIFSEKISEVIDAKTHARERESVLQFQRNMLSGLLIATKHLRALEGYNCLHYAFAVPQDRFAELRLRETSVFDVKHIKKIEWTPLHLLEFFVRRCLWVFGECAEFDSSEGLIKQYKKLLKRLNFAETVKNQAVSDVREDFLLYLIRHSMWRPRDLQRYLLELFEGYAKAGVTDGDNFEDRVYRVVNECSQRIINDEFLIEYQVEYPRLAEIIDRFKNRQNVFDEDFLRNRILGQRSLSLNHHKMTTDAIIERLYEVGFLGIRKSRNLNKQICVRQHDQYIYYQFCYNDQIVNARFSGPKLNEGEQWVVHPMFYDRLDSTVEKQFVVHQLDWTAILSQFKFFHHIH